MSIEEMLTEMLALPMQTLPFAWAPMGQAATPQTHEELPGDAPAFIQPEIVEQGSPPGMERTETPAPAAEFDIRAETGVPQSAAAEPRPAVPAAQRVGGDDPREPPRPAEAAGMDVPPSFFVPAATPPQPQPQAVPEAGIPDRQEVPAPGAGPLQFQTRAVPTAAMEDQKSVPAPQAPEITQPDVPVDSSEFLPLEERAWINAAGLGTPQRGPSPTPEFEAFQSASTRILEESLSQTISSEMEHLQTQMRGHIDDEFSERLLLLDRRFD